MKKSKYDDMTYGELLHAVFATENTSGREARQMHRALKRFGDGLLLRDRYPILSLWSRHPSWPLYISAFSLVVSVLVLVLLR